MLKKERNMSKFDVQRCHTCGEIEFEDRMLEYNDKFYCGLPHKLKQEREKNENLNSTNVDVRQLDLFGRSRQRK